MSARPILLGVNIDHVATLRQARYRQLDRTCGTYIEPDPVLAAQVCEQAGADGITVHLREDRRHIQPRDVHRLRECIATRLNLEMACTDEMLKVALEVKPDAVCLVPENRTEVTTEGGLDVIAHRSRIRPILDQCERAGIIVSLFIDPDPAQIEMARKLGANCIELHTGAYAHAYPTPRRGAELDRLDRAAELAHREGVTVNAGHGINYVNIAELRGLPHVHEMNIGHALVARAVFTGLGEAVREMKRLMVAP